ncbi:glutathione transferase [Coleophoma cylindrospora]|uniref:glutathione transferase n=1 Tax=Coleophoma cylindrospora TaxID=1849047 RepID=A0A3D8QTB6_9HELO|nr:glutathione transferase [Coleophoma cylindrospora]
MAIKLHGDPRATCYQRVAFVLAELGLAYETVTISLARQENKSPEFLKLQPFGKVPALVDDGFVVFESRAICKYLARKYATPGARLVPEDGDFEGLALFEQAASIEQSYFDPPCGAYAYEKIYKKFYGQETDEAAAATRLATLDSVLAVYDGLLAQRQYLAGERLTLADLFHVPYAVVVKAVGAQEVFDRYPRVRKWLEGLEARESWKNLAESGREGVV